MFAGFEIGCEDGQAAPASIIGRGYTCDDYRWDKRTIAKQSKFLELKVRPVGLLMAGGGVAAAATMLGFLGQFGWLLDLFSHFRAQYAVVLTLVIILSCFTRE